MVTSAQRLTPAAAGLARRGRGPNILIDPHRACWHTGRCGWSAVIFRSLHFTYLPDVCLYDDDLPIANLEPGVSGRNSLPLSALWAQGLSWYPRFSCLSIFVSNFASILRSILDLILDQKSFIFQSVLLNKNSSSVFGVIIDVFLSCVCTSDVLKSRFYCRKTTIFKDLHVF